MPARGGGDPCPHQGHRPLSPPRAAARGLRLVRPEPARPRPGTPGLCRHRGPPPAPVTAAGRCGGVGGQVGTGGDTRASCPRRLVGLTQEHGQVEAVNGQLDFEQFPVGSILALIPYHVSVSPACPLGASAVSRLSVPSVTGLCHGCHAPRVLRARCREGGGALAPRARLVERRERRFRRFWGDAPWTPRPCTHPGILHPPWTKTLHPHRDPTPTPGPTSTWDAAPTPCTHSHTHSHSLHPLPHPFPLPVPPPPPDPAPTLTPCAAPRCCTHTGAQ